MKGLWPEDLVSGVGGWAEQARCDVGAWCSEGPAPAAPSLPTAKAETLTGSPLCLVVSKDKLELHQAPGSPPSSLFRPGRPGLSLQHPSGGASGMVTSLLLSMLPILQDPSLEARVPPPNLHCDSDGGRVPVAVLGVCEPSGWLWGWGVPSGQRGSKGDR